MQQREREDWLSKIDAALASLKHVDGGSRSMSGTVDGEASQNERSDGDAGVQQS